MSEASTLERLSDYISTALERPLPPVVTEKTKHHVLDTLAAMVSGSRLKPGELAIKFVSAQGGSPESTVVGSSVVTAAVSAAMANGMLAHADETDDSHSASLTHPGCAIVPAALAVAEREEASGEELLKAVALGYDVGCRIGLAMGGQQARSTHGHATHAIGPMFGAAAAAAALTHLDPRGVSHCLAYAAQQASGITSWARDSEHVEKAFVFGGMGARNGVTAALFIQAGLTGEDDVFSGDFNFLEVFCPMAGELSGWVDSLGSRYEITATNIKKFPVGSPIQAAAEALSSLVAEHNIHVDEVRQVEVLLPPQGARIVDNRAMPDINCQYCMAVILLDGRLSFQATHTYERLDDPKVREVQNRVRLVPAEEFANMERQRPARVRVHLHQGKILERYVPAVRGTSDNPMTREEVEVKALDLLVGVLGEGRAHSLVKAIWALDDCASIRGLRTLIQAHSQGR